MPEYNIDRWYPNYYKEKKIDAAHLNDKEYRVYDDLLAQAWRHPTRLKDDDKYLAKLVGVSTRSWKLMRSNLLELFSIENGVWYSKALHSERFVAVHNRMKKSKGGYAKNRNFEKVAEMDKEIADFEAAHALHLHSKCTDKSPARALPIPDLTLPITNHIATHTEEQASDTKIADALDDLPDVSEAAQ